MAEKRIDIQHLLGTIGVRLNIPPFCRENQQMTPEEVLKTKKITAVRIHMERAINRLKQYSLVSGVIPNTLWDIADQIIQYNSINDACTEHKYNYKYIFHI